MGPTPEFRGNTPRHLDELRGWTQRWKEAALDPALPIIDPHHHLWTDALGRTPYLLADLWSDTGAGHRIESD